MKSWHKIYAKINEQSSSEYNEKRFDLFKQNYINAIKKEFGSMGDDLISLIEGLDSEFMIRSMYMDFDLSISFIYAPEEKESKLREIYDTWMMYIFNGGG